MKKNQFKKLAVLGITGGVALTAQSVVFADQVVEPQPTYLAASCGQHCGGSKYRSGSSRDSTTAYEYQGTSSCSGKVSVSGMENSSFPSSGQMSPGMNSSSGTYYNQGTSNPNLSGSNPNMSGSNSNLSGYPNQNTSGNWSNTNNTSNPGSFYNQQPNSDEQQQFQNSQQMQGMPNR